MGIKKVEQKEKAGGIKPGFRENFAELLGVPADAAADVPRIVVSGYRELLMTSHQGVLEYTSEQIRIQGGKAMIRITGTDLTIRAMNLTGLSVTGNIRTIDFES